MEYLFTNKERWGKIGLLKNNPDFGKLFSPKQSFTFCLGNNSATEHALFSRTVGLPIHQLQLPPMPSRMENLLNRN